MNSTFIAVAAMFAAAAANAQTAPASNSATPKITTKLLGKPVDIGAKPPPGNPGKNITLSPDTFNSPGTNRTLGDTALGATVTIPLGGEKGKK